MKTTKKNPKCRYCNDAQCKLILAGVLVLILSTIVLGYWIINNIDEMDTVYTSHFVRCLDNGDQDALNTYYQDHVVKDDYCFNTSANVVLCCNKYKLDQNFVEDMYFESCYYGDFQKFFDKVLKPFYI